MNETGDTSAAKILAVLEALSQSGRTGAPGLSVAALARAVGRDKSSMSRQLKPLVELGLVERDEQGLHRLGWRLFAVAAQAGDQRLLLLAPPVMGRLARGLRERVHLTIRRGTEAFTILSEGPQRSVEAVGWVGHTVPASCTSSGRALLFDHTPDELRELFACGVEKGSGASGPKDVEDVIKRVTAARRRGFAPVRGEFDEDLYAVAAPVRDARGQITAALNVSAPAYRMRSSMDSAGRHVSQAAAHLSRAMSSPPGATA